MITTTSEVRRSGPKLTNSDGSLTRYALSCGYLERIGDPRGWNVTLDMPSPSTGFLRVTIWAKDVQETKTFHTMKDARKAFRLFARSL